MDRGALLVSAGSVYRWIQVQLARELVAHSSLSPLFIGSTAAEVEYCDRVFVGGGELCCVVC